MRALAPHARQPHRSSRRRRVLRKRRIITAIGSDCANAFASVGADALSDYELLEMVLFRALPRGT